MPGRREKEWPAELRKPEPLRPSPMRPLISTKRDEEWPTNLRKPEPLRPSPMQPSMPRRRGRNRTQRNDPDHVNWIRKLTRLFAHPANR